MTGLSRKLGLAVLVLGLGSAVLEAQPRQDLQASFDEGVALLKRGRADEALAKFREVLAADPSNEDAYELWKNTDEEVLLDLLVRGGEFELIQKDLYRRAAAGRAEREPDADVIRPLVDQAVNSDDFLERNQAVSTLAREHGEYAAPFLINFLRDAGDRDRRVSALHALQVIGADAVLPLAEALRANDELVRRSAASALAAIGDPRAIPALAAMAQNEPNETARSVAVGALAKMDAAGTDPVQAYLQMGHDYHNRRESVLRGSQYSDVVWDWSGDGLVGRAVARELYHDELAERAFARALELDPSSLAARAGFAGALVSQQAKLEELEALGQDVSEARDAHAQDVVAVNLAGAAALDQALTTALGENDSRTAAGLARMLARVSDAPTAGLSAALGSTSASVRSEAAIAIGKIAMAHGTPVDARAVAALAEAAGREVVQIAAIIDGDEARASSLAAALEARGVSVQIHGSGALGLAMVNRMAGLDLLIVADHLEDLTTFQVLGELADRPKTANVPVVVLSSSEDTEDLFGDKAAAIVTGAEDMEAIEAALSGEMNRDREEADRLAAQATEALAFLARTGGDVSGALGALASTLTHRADAVAIPAMTALGRAGGEEALHALAAVATDAERSDEAREAAARACAGIFRRGALPSAEEISALMSVVGGDTSLEVQSAAALALGTLNLDEAQRAQILENMTAGASN